MQWRARLGAKVPRVEVRVGAGAEVGVEAGAKVIVEVPERVAEAVLPRKPDPGSFLAALLDHAVGRRGQREVAVLQWLAGAPAGFAHGAVASRQTGWRHHRVGISSAFDLVGTNICILKAIYNNSTSVGRTPAS